MAVLALVCASVPFVAHPIPVLGQLTTNLTWSPGAPPVGTTVTFTATASDGDGAIVVGTICYGDGSPCQSEASSPSLVEQATACLLGTNWSNQWSHRFMRTGDFRVTLSVISRGCPGSADESKTIGYTLRVG